MRFFQISLLVIPLMPVSASNLTKSNVTTAPGVFDLVNANLELTILNSLMDIIPSFRRSISNGNYSFLAVNDAAFQSFNKSNPTDFLIFQTDINFLTDFLQSNNTLFSYR